MQPVFAILWCPTCWQRTDFCLAPDAAPGDSMPPIECSECGHTFEPRLRRYDAKGVEYEHPTLEYPIPPEVLDQGRLAVRTRLHDVWVGSGYNLSERKRPNA